MIERLLLAGVNHRLVTFLALVLVTVLAARGLEHLEVDTGLASLISGTDPDRQAYLRVAAEFGSDNRTVVYVRDEALWTPAKIAALARLHDALDALEPVERVESILTARTVRGRGERIDVRALLPEGALDGEALERAREAALANPLLRGSFLSADGKATALLVTVRPPRGEAHFDERVNAALERALASEGERFDELFQIGPPRINAELKAAMLSDLRLLGPLSAALLVLTILLFLGSPFAAIVPLVTAGLSIVWTFGLLGHLGIHLNILSAMLPSLVVVIGSTEDTHLVATYLQAVGRGEGPGRGLATRLAVRKLGIPTLLTVLTTALGFAANLLSSIELIRAFALAATTAILANGLITVLLVPMLLSVAGPRRARAELEGGRPGGIPGLIARVFGFGRTRLAGPILVLTVLLCGFFLYQASKLYVTNDPFSYFREGRRLLTDARLLQRDLAGVKVFYVTLEAERERAFLEPGNLERLAAIQRFIAEQGIFDRSVSIADYLALVNREFHGGDPERHVLPRKRELVAQYLMFFHRQDLAGLLSADLRRANIVVRHNVSDSRTLNPHIRELKEAAQRIAGPGLRAYVVGENLMINAAAEDLISGQAESLALLVAVIFVLMSAMFTSLKGGLIALVPTLIPIILMFGAMGMLGIALNPGTAMVAVIAVGIAVDGTIHLFSRYNERSRQRGDNEQAVRETVEEEALPVVATSIALALGFGILLFSSFSIIAQFGALAAATMLFAVFANLLITPIILTRVRLVGLYEILTVRMRREVFESSPLFRHMSRYQVRKAILISHLQRFAPGELLIEQGSRGRSMYLILTGRVEVVHRAGARLRRLSVQGPGAVLGEVGYVREIRRTADVRALEPVEALRFDYERMRHDLRHFPRTVSRLNFNISRILGERLAEVMETADPPGEAGPGGEEPGADGPLESGTPPGTPSSAVPP